MVRILICLPLCLGFAPGYPRAPLPAVERGTQEISGTLDSALPNPHTEPVAFLEACLKRYDEKITAYSLTFRKQERIDGQQKALEIVEVHYRDQPHSVYFRWLQPKQREVMRALYVEGENKGGHGKSRVKVKTMVGFALDKEPDGDEAKKQSRYPINSFGLRQAMVRVLDSWKAAQAEKALHVAFQGLHVVPETGHRVCYKFTRTKFARPEGDDGVAEVTIYIDRETLLQVGSIVHGVDGQKLGEYFFSDIQLNPTFGPGQFTPAAFK